MLAVESLKLRRIYGKIVSGVVLVRAFIFGGRSHGWTD